MNYEHVYNIIQLYNIKNDERKNKKNVLAKCQYQDQNKIVAFVICYFFKLLKKNYD